MQGHNNQHHQHHNISHNPAISNPRSNPFTMDYVNNAMRLNDEGVVNMMAGKDQAAVTLFSSSLSAIFTVLRDDSRAPSSHSPPQRSESCRPIGGDDVTPMDTSPRGGNSGCPSSSTQQVAAEPLYQVGDCVHSQVLPVPGMQKDDDLSFLYCSAVTLCPQDDPSQQQQQQRQVSLLFGSDNNEAEADADQYILRVYAASIVFNLALVYHRRGRQNFKQVCFQKALNMYDMVRKLLFQETLLLEEGQDSKRSSGTSLLLLLAAVNNASQIRFDQGKYTQAQEGLRLVGGLFHRYSASVGQDVETNDETENTTRTTTNDENATTSNNNSRRERHLLGDQEMKGFLLNVLLLSPPSMAPAA